ncbi:MAG: hypothetical protein H0T42_31100 [Deltaproteobacteria bacterium]|nr:hypothetical protein [Deltaproteobacteria bacterium]
MCSDLSHEDTKATKQKVDGLRTCAARARAVVRVPHARVPFVRVPLVRAPLVRALMGVCSEVNRQGAKDAKQK